MINASIMNIGREASPHETGPDTAKAIAARTVDTGRRAPGLDFKDFLKQDPVGPGRGNEARSSDGTEKDRGPLRTGETPGRISEDDAVRESRGERSERDVKPVRTDAAERTKGSDRTERADKHDRAEKTASKRKAEAKTGSHETTDAKTVPMTEASRKSLSAEIAAFLAKHGVKIGGQTADPTTGKTQKELEKALLSLEDKDLRDLKKSLEAAKAGGMMHPGAVKQFASLVRDRLKETERAGSKPKTGTAAAFHVETDGQDRKIFVNKSRIHVVDTRVERKARMTGADAAAQTAEKTQSPEQSVRKDGASTQKFDQLLSREGQARHETAPQQVRPAVTSDPRAVNQAFNDLVKWSKLMVDERKSVMQIDLKPEHLGKVTLKIEVIDNKVSAQIFAQNQGTGDMFKQNMGDLYNAFKQAGLDVGRLDVNVSSGSGEDRSFQERMASSGGLETHVPQAGSTETGYADLLNFGSEAGQRTVNYIV